MATPCKYRCINGRVFMESTRSFHDCPDCRNIKKVLETQNEDGVSIYDKLMIPEAYKSAISCDRELFVDTPVNNMFTKSSITKVEEVLLRINKDLYNGRVSNSSMYIYVSSIVDIRKFVYGAQKLALEKGLGVTPFISLNTLYGLQRVVDYDFRDLEDAQILSKTRSNSSDLIAAYDGIKFIERTKLTYYDFIHADLCFLEATATTTERGWAVLADLLSERSRNGLPTYVIGYWTSSYLQSGKTGFRYLVADNRVFRLDKLAVFELISKRRSNQEGDLGVETNLSFGSSTSSVTAGINISAFSSRK